MTRTFSFRKPKIEIFSSEGEYAEIPDLIVELADEGAGEFIEITDTRDDNKIRLDFDEIDAVAKAVNGLRKIAHN